VDANVPPITIIRPGIFRNTLYWPPKIMAPIKREKPIMSPKRVAISICLQLYEVPLTFILKKEKDKCQRKFLKR